MITNAFRLLGLLTVVMAATGVMAQETTPATTAATVTASDQPPAPAGAADIVHMLDAGVSHDVIIAYLENTTVTSHLTPADLVALKDNKVADDITVLLLKRSAQVKAQSAATASAETTKATSPAPAQTIRVVNTGRLDPESYDYFQHYYLLPRTLAYTYQTLGYTPGPYGYAPYGAGYYAPYHRPRYAYRPGF